MLKNQSRNWQLQLCFGGSTTSKDTGILPEHACNSQFHFSFTGFLWNKQFSLVLIAFIDNNSINSESFLDFFQRCSIIYFIYSEPFLIPNVLNNLCLLTFIFIQNIHFSSLYNILSHFSIYFLLWVHIIAHA